MSDPRTTLETAIQTAIDSFSKELHTCLPAIIQSIDTVEQTVDAQPTIKRKIKNILEDLPLLTGVPIRFPKCSDFSMTWPIKTGDYVMIIFAERSIDNWLINGGLQNPGDIRKHSLSDAFAIPMMYPQTDKITSFDDTNLQIRTTTGKGITLTPAGVLELNGNADFVTAFTDMETAFNQLKTDFNNLTTAYNTHIHVTTATIGAGATPGVLSPTLITGTPSTADMSSAKVNDVKVT